MAKAKEGDTVKVHYTGTLTSGVQFDSSAGSEPLEFTLGEGMVIPGFDLAVLGMEIGEKKSVTIACEEAYGPVLDENVIEISRDELPEDMSPEVGDELQMVTPDGMPIPVTVLEVSETSITIDGNHELAGEDLTFALELVSIN